MVKPQPLQAMFLAADGQARTRGCFWASPIGTTALFPKNGRGATDLTASNSHIQGLIDAGKTIRGVVIVGCLLHNVPAPGGSAGNAEIRLADKTTAQFGWDWDQKGASGPSKQGWFIPLMRELPRAGWNFSAVTTVANHRVDIMYRIY